VRRLVILFLLLAGLQLILPLGETGRASQWLLTLGFLILAAYSVGEIASGLGLPKIVGYLVGGIAFGPEGLNTVTREASTALEPVSSLAIALIAYLAGAELRWDEVRTRGVAILKILTAEMGLTLVLLTTLLALIGSRLPFMEGLGPVGIIALSLLFASIAVVHSPAVTLALLTETGATGPVARTTLGVVLVADVVVVLLFSGALALARAVAPSSASGAEVAAGLSAGAVAWELGGAVLVGTLFGAVIALYLRFIKGELFLFAVMIAFAGLVLSRLLHVETLLMLLTAGFVSENVSLPEDGEALRKAMERSAHPVFVVFFALAGTHIHLATIAQSFALVIPIALARGLGIWGGTRIGVRWAGISGSEGRYLWAGLVSQAGVAIGLATLVAQAYPIRGVELQTILLGVIGINEMIGPILFRRALTRSGEAGGGTPDREPSRSEPATAPA
jgi:Kef-type K+ transport system membrane component KefB